MNLRTSTVAGICFFLGGLMLVLPVTLFDTEYDGIDNDRMSWSCDRPILGLTPADVDLDTIRAELAELPPDEKLDAAHPECRKLARAQVALASLAFAGGIWQALMWWRETADARAEKKFEKLQEKGSGKPKGLLS